MTTEPVDPKTLLGQTSIIVATRDTLSISLPIDAAMERYDEADEATWEPLYLIPLLIEPDGGVFDRPGQRCMRGQRLWASYAAVYEKSLPKAFPSLVKLINWRTLFTNIFETNKDLKPRIKDTKYPILQLTGKGETAILEAVAEMCRRDRLIEIAGPVGF
jgi:hypothetical protein